MEKTEPIARRSPPGRRIGIKEIAQAAGVSQTTVSQVLGNGKRHVRPETREMISRMASELGYQPNAVARGLAKRRMNTIGIVIHHTTLSSNTNPTLTEILDGILAVTTRRHQHANIVTFSDWDLDDSSFSSLTDGRCDGIIVVVPPDDVNPTAKLVSVGIPSVQVGVQSPDPNVSSVDVDNVAAGESIADHLISLGHRRIAFICDMPTRHQFVDLRLQGLKNSALRSTTPVEVVEVPYSPGGNVLGSALDSSLDQRPTAILCATDNCAAFVLQKLQDNHIRVPEDISVAGFDDNFMSKFLEPPLTTVRLPFAAFGEKATELVLAQIDSSSHHPEQILLQTELVVRKSTGPVPGRAFIGKATNPSA